MLKKYHKCVEIVGTEYIVPYGKFKILQFFYIYNPYLYFKSDYKWRSHITICKYNCNWIPVVKFNCSFKRNRDINDKNTRDQKKNVKIKVF